MKECNSCSDSIKNCIDNKYFSDEQSRFIYFINKILASDGFGADIIEHASFLELMTFLNKIYIKNHTDFNDYSNFLKTFKKAVGSSPKKYSNFSAS